MTSNFRGFIIGLFFLLSSCSGAPIGTDTPIELSDIVRTPTNTPQVITTSTISRLNLPTQTNSIPLAAAIKPTPLETRSTPIIDDTNEIIGLTREPLAFQVCSPLDSETIPELWEIVSDPYNPPPPGREERHHGVDFSYYTRKERNTIEGEVVQSMMAGQIAAAITDRLPYGNFVIIETGYAAISPSIAEQFHLDAEESLYHLYAHLQEPPLVTLGESVECGAALGKVGKTGYNIVNPHLHLETRIGPAGVRFDGMAFYDSGATREEMDAYIRWRTSGEFVHFDPLDFLKAFLELEK